MPRNDLAFFREDLGDTETTASARGEGRGSAVETLAAFALDAAMPSGLRRRLAGQGSLALVVEVPSAEWVDPVARACDEIGAWNVAFARTGASRTEDRPDRGNDKVAKVLAGGGRALGVSQAPGRLLPSALVAAADARLRLGAPSNRVVARVVRAATGRQPGTMPPRVAAGLGYWEICTAVRGSPRDCVERLVALVRTKSAVDAGPPDAPDFRTLVGYGEAHAWGARFLDDLEAWRRDELDFHRIDRTVVLGSEPGLGKTTLVRALAKAARLPLVVTSVSAWFTQSSYLDGVIRQIDAVFDDAASRGPSIIFLDEIDSIPNRHTLDSKNRDWWNTLITHILLTVDRVLTERSVNVCIVGATNYPQRLDAALVRPGRLNRVIRIMPPSAPELAGIARQHLGGDLPGLDLAPFGEIALGATGAQGAGWVEDARTVARAAGRPMRPDDLMHAVAPPDTRPARERWRSSIHEAGHAVGVEVLRAGRVRQVDAIMRPDRGGSTSIVPFETMMPLKDDLERLAMSLLCGRAAEAAFLGEACGGAGGAGDSDLARATALVAGIHGSFGLGAGLAYLGTMDEVARALRSDGGLRATVETDLARLQAEARQVVERHANVVHKVAELLHARRVVSGDALRALIAGSTAPAGPAGGCP